jgi:hypothetical protein
MSTVDEKLANSALKEIDRLLKLGMIPVNNGHLRGLNAEVDVLDLSLVLRHGGLISGDLITVGAHGGTPHKMTNIRLTYVGIKKLNTEASADLA